MTHRIVLERKSVQVKPKELALGSGATYEPSFSKEDITYADVRPEHMDELLALAGKAYGVASAYVSDETKPGDGREVTIG